MPGYSVLAPILFAKTLGAALSQGNNNADANDNQQVQQDAENDGDPEQDAEP